MMQALLTRKAVMSSCSLSYSSVLSCKRFQRRATKFILNYPKQLYSERLVTVNILPLEFRREISDLCLLFKSRTHSISTDVNNFITTFEPEYCFRNYDPNNYNILVKHKQEYFRKSFFIRTAELWNTLPSHVKAFNSLALLKSHLKRLYCKKLPLYVPPGSA